MKPEVNVQQSRSILTVKQFSDKYPAFSQGSLRHLIFFEDTNGFKPAFRRCGRRVLIDESAFFGCLDAVNDEREDRCHT